MRPSSPTEARRRRVPWLLLALLAPFGWSPGAEGAPTPTRRNEPSVGYVFPAGGQVGTRVAVEVGGQFLRNVSGAHVSGSGVTAKVGVWVPPPAPLDAEVARVVRRTLTDLIARRATTTPRAGREGRPSPPAEAPKEGEPPLPDHPLLKDLESKSLDELQDIARYFFTPRNPLQRKRSIEETVQVEITIAPDAEPGWRDLRLLTNAGVTNPLRFRVGLHPEVREREPIRTGLPETATVDLPVVLNGQILPRDEDRFRFRARQGQNVVVRTEARALVPYQADSVPGWMQATVAVYDADGTELGYADEFRFDPDPVLVVTIPRDGEYVLQVRDAIDRGREDFVYRLTVGELPFVTRIFPLGGRQGDLVNASVEGWNLGWTRVPLDTRGEPGLRETAWRIADAMTNEVRYEVGTLEEMVEVEPNDQPGQAQPVALGRIVNGTIGEADDVDWFAFEARGGSEVVLEVSARRLGSPLDSVVRLVDDKGTVLAWSDDAAPENLGVRGLGLQTHHADSYVRAPLPRTGRYLVRIADVTSHGGPAHAYRLRISPPRPDVELYVTPSAINVPAGRTALVAVRAVRKDGFDGDVDITLEDAPPGFVLGGAQIPTGSDLVWMTLTAPAQGSPTPFGFRFQGHLRLDREDVVRPVTPAEDVMQAFLWRHLVPTQGLAVAVLGEGRSVPIVELVNEEPLRLARGGRAEARFRVSRRVPVENLRFVLLDPPPGVTVGKARAMGDGFTLEFRASGDVERTERVDNLIVEAFVEQEVKPPKADPKQAPKDRRAGRREMRRYSLGLLPAIPFVIRRG